MADAISSAWVEVLPDFSDFTRKANAGITSGLSDAGDRGARSMGTSMRGVFGGAFFGAIVADLGASIVSGITNAIQTGLDAGLTYAFDSVSLASDLSETKSAIQQVFGDAANDIIDFSSTASTRLGQTQQAALSAAQTFGVFGQAAGLSGAELSGFSTDLVLLSGDLASFFNTAPEDAIQAIGAGLRGESEPLRQYGILLDDAALKARALQLGIFDGTGALTQQQRVLAAQAEIFAQSSIAQGDFERTSGGLANQQRILAASLQDTQARLGEALLPAATELVQLLNTDLLPVIEDVIDQVGPVLSQALVESLPSIKELVVSFAPLIPDLVKLNAELLPVIVALLIALAPVIIDVAQAMAEGAANLNALIEVFKGTGTVQQFFDTVAGGSSTFLFFQRTVVGVLNDVLNNMNAFFAAIQRTPAFSAGVSIIQNFIGGIQSMLKPLSNALTSLMSFVAGFFPHSPALRGPFSGSGWREVAAGGASLAKQFSDGFNAAPSLSFSTNAGGLSIASPAGFAADGVVSEVAAGAKQFIFKGLDPYAAMQVAKQELGGRLDTL